MLFACLLAGGDASAGPLPAVGETHRLHLPLLGKPVPLPPGDWVVAGQGYGKVEGPSPGPYGVIGGVMLVQQRQGAVAGVVLAQANLLPVEAGWGPAPDCRDAAAFYATGVRTRGRSLACAYVLLPPASAKALGRQPAWSAGQAEIAWRGWRMPGAWAVAGLRVGSRREVVDLRYAWAMAPRPSPGYGDAGLMPAAAAAAASAQVPAGALGPWIVGAMEELERRLADPLAPMADLPLPGAGPPLAYAPAGTDPWERRLGQALSSRFIHASLSLGTGFAVTGSAYAAGVLAAWYTLVAGAGAHLAELGWDWEPPRPAMDFVAVPPRPAG